VESPEPSIRALLNRPGARSLSAPAAYALAIAALLAAVLLRYALHSWMGPALPLVTLFGAVAAAVWVGGYRPAILVTILGYGACDYLFIEPRFSFHVGDPGNLIGLLPYLVTSALIIVVGEAARRAEQRANEQRELLRITLHSIGDAVITTDVQGRVTYMNAVAESLTGWATHDGAGRHLDAVFRIVNEETRRPVENPAARALREGAVVGLANHTLLIRKDGSECPIDDSAAPIRDEDGSMSGCVLIFRDVTAQRRMERDRANQFLTDRLLASIIESSDDAIISKSLDGVIQSWNSSAERLFGYTASQAVGRHISLVIPPERRAEEDEIIASLKAGQRIEHFETERLRSDSSRIFVSLTISPIKDETGNVVGASKIVRDVTDRRRAEAERQKFVTLVENSTDFIGICDLEGIHFFVNRAGLEMVGLDDLEAARSAPLQSFFFPEDQGRIVQEFLPQVLEKGHGEIEVRFRHFKTGAARWMAYKLLTLPDASGRPVAFATVSQDVTERKRLEDDLIRLAANLSEADRRKNEFLAMLAHELRNPLAPISNTVQALHLGGGDAETLRSASAMLQRQVGQMSRLVDDLLDMSRITRGKIELRKGRVELAPIIQQAVEAARAQYRSLDHELTITLPPRPVHLDADPARLAQVVGNLLSNAAKFTDRGGHVWLTVEEDGAQAVIRVRDNGIGIAAEHHPRLFEMFAQVDTSLERSRDGLGIGLTLVKTLVELHGGTVDVHSDGPGRGCEFTVRLPVPIDTARVVPPPAVVHPVRAASRRVLIVDDSEDGAESLAMLLEFGGHTTYQAHDGVAALEAANRLRPDAVLLDIGLPGLNGYEVCRRIRNEPWGKQMMLVALTGWGQDEDRHRSREAGFDAHMVKPVDFDVLLKLLASRPSTQDVQPPSTRR
jgi:PAS domain S-box-containing protein